mmetsp:Transcript_2207/g.1913  ORF Transcript_2207/g.1913 Transcript_2207/m.1913 type:complete len:139 (+) Transcript_2207:196-612(+)
MREKMDISDFNLVKWLEIHCEQKEETNVVGIAKHLCGGATDLTLTSFQHLSRANHIAANLDGLAIATCCHHRCDTLTYVNLQFIKEKIPQLVNEGNVCPIAFQKFARASSWAVSPNINLQKRAAGFKVKRILDLGRLL